MSAVKTKPTHRKKAAEENGLAYRAPALEKGLDVLELLAGQSEGLILSQIAQSLGRSVQEVYRVVVSLERRGYVVRHQPGDSFQLSMKLFDLACNHPPQRRLVQAARSVMQRLTDEVDQSVILSVIEGTTIRVIHVAENPAPIGFRVRLGTQSPILRTASGRTLVAFQPPRAGTLLAKRLAATMRRAKEDPDPLLERIERIRRRGYELVSDETLRGITDISFPILDGDGVAQAVMTMPFLVWVANKVEIEEAEQRLFDGAQAVSQEIGGRLERPQFPLARE